MTPFVHFLVVLGLAAIPAIIWLVFFLREDTHPEPVGEIVKTFFFGALISVPVLALQLLFQKAIPESLNNIIFVVIGLALIEETFKFAAAYLAIGHDKVFKEPIDAMIYMIVAALGFATVENFFITWANLPLASYSGILTALSTLGLRFVGATLLHALASGALGYYWALTHFEHMEHREGFGLLLATVIHAIFNLLIYQFQDTQILYPTLFLVVAAAIILTDFEKLKVAEARETHL